jgi:acyl-CoA synthetase (AMP-forming)/AMP-acid ligase II
MTTHDRTSGYRSAGWWPDEDLAHRYLTTVQGRLDDLAVADDQGRELTHAQLLDAASQMAAHFGDAGIARDDVVLSIMPNMTAWQVVFLSLLQLGARPMTIPVTTDADTIAYLCDLTGTRAVVTAGTHGSTQLTEVAATAGALATSRPAVIVVGGGDNDDDQRIEIVHRAAVERLTSNGIAFDHVMTTSSTTGKPKAVLHTNNTLAALNIGFAERFGLTGRTPLFMASPLGHSVGAIHGARLALYLGAPLILQDRWDPQVAIELAARYRCEFTCAATPFLKDLVDAPTGADQPKMHTIRTFLSGGAAVPPSLLDAADAQFPNTFVSVLWGMTEGGVTTCEPTSTPEQRRHSAGRGLPGLELSIIDPVGEHLATGEVGELVMRGPGVFTGYLGQDDLYRECLTSDGFFRTGDLARLDDDGYVHLTGRLKDLIIRGGVNISPVPIEDALAGHPGVKRVVIVGEPDDRLGERLCAVVVPAGSHDITIESLVDWASAQGLPRRYLPESIRVVHDMPQTAVGKIKKNQLRDELFGKAP